LPCCFGEHGPDFAGVGMIPGRKGDAQGSPRSRARAQRHTSGPKARESPPPAGPLNGRPGRRASCALAGRRPAISAHGRCRCRKGPGAAKSPTGPGAVRSAGLPGVPTLRGAPARPGRRGLCGIAAPDGTGADGPEGNRRGFLPFALHRPPERDPVQGRKAVAQELRTEQRAFRHKGQTPWSA
jgi:hypothetical protein